MKTSYMLINIRDPLNGSELTLYDVQMKRWAMLFRVSGGNAFSPEGGAGLLRRGRLAKEITINFL
jgi:hypothetical protein